jgi:hypothetical protein
MTKSHPPVFHYRTSNKYSRCKPPNCSRNIPQQALDGGILPQGFLPAETDILCGRGKAFVSHKGNKSFSDIVRKNLHRYIDAPKRLDKSTVVASVVSEILNSGARFVKQEKISGRWYQMNEDQAHEKTGHAIRDLIKSKTAAGNEITSIASSSKASSKQSSHKAPSSKSALAKKKMLKASKTRRSMRMEPFNVLAQEFCLNSFEFDFSRNFSLKRGGMLNTVLKLHEAIDDDIPCAPSLLPVVSDDIFPTAVVSLPNFSLQANSLEDLDEVTISDDFFSERSAAGDFMDDLSVDLESPSFSRNVLSYSPMRPVVTPSAKDFARVYELLSSDEESSAGE